MKETVRQGSIFLILSALLMGVVVSRDSGFVNSDAVQAATAYSNGRSMLYPFFLCQSDDGKRIFELCAYKGSFRTTGEQGTEFVSDLVLEGGGEAYWGYDPPDGLANDRKNNAWWHIHHETAFIGILMKEDGRYIGWALVKAVPDPNNFTIYDPIVLMCRELKPEKRDKILTAEKLQAMMDAAMKRSQRG